MPHVVAGLGNPGEEYRDTRHNVGHWVVEALARKLGAEWRREGRNALAHGRWRGDTVYLLKPRAFMNVSGPPIAAALRSRHLEPIDLILVYDDIDLPLGTVRVRMKGSHGGHNGVRSVLEALGTSDIRRVKIGIGRPAHKAQGADHVLATFDPDERPVIDAAVDEAVEKLLELAAR